MPGFVAAIASAEFGNWSICKKHGIWGVASGNNANKAAQMVKPGDSIFVWRSKDANGRGGLFARTEATGRAVPAVRPPWPNGARYSYTIPVKFTHEIEVPIGDSFPGNKTSILFEIENMWVTWGFWHLPDHVAAKMGAALHHR